MLDEVPQCDTLRNVSLSSAIAIKKGHPPLCNILNKMKK